MMKNSNGYLLVFLILTFGCANESKVEEIFDFDISPDDRNIVFSLSDGRNVSLFSMKIDGDSTKLLLHSNDSISYSGVSYSGDGSSILFIKSYSDKILKSSLCTAQRDGSNVRTQLMVNEIITEAIFSKNGKEIIFCKANQFDNYSPLARKSPHGFDIFSYGISTRTVKKITSLNAYNILHISEIDSTHLLFRVEAAQESAIYMVVKEHPEDLIRILPTNRLREDYQYSNPVFNQNANVLIFTAPYELYSMNMTDKIASLIYDAKGLSPIQIVRTFNKEKKVLFRESHEKKIIHILDLVSKNDELINVEAKIN
jgi:hypothetical protein